jgi:hypothetical protein
MADHGTAMKFSTGNIGPGISITPKAKGPASRGDQRTARLRGSGLGAGGVAPGDLSSPNASTED